MAIPIKLTAASAIKLRGSTYWFIKQCPKELRDKLGVQRWRFSLNTTDRQVALRRADNFLVEVREALSDNADPASTYFKELDKLRHLSKEDAEALLDVTYPELYPSQVPIFYAARKAVMGTEPPAELFTLLSVARQYLKTAKESVQEPTMIAVRLFGPDVPFTAIDRRMVGDFKELREQTVSVSTLRGNLSYLQTVYRYGMRLGLVDYSKHTPFSDWQLRVEEQNRTEPMPDVLYKALYEDLGDLRWTMVVSRLSSLRPSEACRVELQERSGLPVWYVKHSKTKAGRGRIVPVHSSIRDVAEHIVPHLSLAASERARKRLTNLKSRGVSPFADYKGQKVDMYSGRVSAITEMGMASAEIRRAIAGHRDIHENYIHEYPMEKLVEAVEMIHDPHLSGSPRNVHRMALGLDKD